MVVAEWILALLLMIYPNHGIDVGDIEVYILADSTHNMMMSYAMPYHDEWESHSRYTSAVSAENQEAILVSRRAVEIYQIMPPRVGSIWLAWLIRSEAQYLISLRSPGENEGMEPPAVNPHHDDVLNERERGLFDAMNRERIAHGLGALVLNETLTDIARIRSQDMVDNDYFAHFNPDGESVYTLIRDAGLRFKAVGENLARISGDADRSVAVAIEKLMGSNFHRAVILNPLYTRVGVGAVTDENGVTVFTTVFAG